jgi:hypothetical protein
MTHKRNPEPEQFYTDWDMARYIPQVLVQLMCALDETLYNIPQNPFLITKAVDILKLIEVKTTPLTKSKSKDIKAKLNKLKEAAIGINQRNNRLAFFKKRQLIAIPPDFVEELDKAVDLVYNSVDEAGFYTPKNKKQTWADRVRIKNEALGIDR